MGNSKVSSQFDIKQQAMKNFISLQQGRLTLREVGNDGNPSGTVLDLYMRPLQGKYMSLEESYKFGAMSNMKHNYLHKTNSKELRCQISNWLERMSRF